MKDGRVEDLNIAHSMALEEDKGRNEKPRGAIARGLAGAKEKVFGNQKLEVAQASAQQVGEKLEMQNAEFEKQKQLENREFLKINGEYMKLLEHQFLSSPKYSPQTDTQLFEFGKSFFWGCCKDAIKKLFPEGLSESQKQDERVATQILEEASKNVWK